MPDRVIDLERTMRRNKARENFLAFCGLRLPLDGREEAAGGLVKVGGHAREDGSGYLCLTFLLDTQDQDGLSHLIHQAFGRLNEDELRSLLGQDFVYLIEIGPEQVRSWFVNEVYFYFRSLRGQRRLLLEERLLPALQAVLSMEFQDLQWWGLQKDDQDLRQQKEESFMEHMRRVLGVPETP